MSDVLAEPVRGAVRAPWQRHSTSVPALLLGRTTGHRVLENLTRKIGNFLKPQLVTLVDVGRARQREQDHDRRASPPLAECPVQMRRRTVSQQPLSSHLLGWPIFR